MSHRADEKELIRRCLRGRADAQRELYRRELPPTYNLILRLTGDPADSEDLTQECFLRVFTQLHTFRGEAGLRTWIKRIAINLTMHHLKRQQRLPIVPVEEQHLAPDPRPLPTEGIDPPALHAAIAALPQGCRLVLTLHLLEGYPHAEVAEHLGISVSTSKSQLWRAKQLLRAALHDKRYANG
ncbi:RNA polymerase sigma factor [Lewinella sp. IMCC34183]|uniref:RNA polymerase sigma factor n=1 Tax=Lewinella sp. IMCC34183 TaxID=2248762 RepID=UPI000E23CA03|nr:RNA polymerase sigma factor [Lewinella sp. IMCC34183]